MKTGLYEKIHLELPRGDFLLEYNGRFVPKALIPEEQMNSLTIINGIIIPEDGNKRKELIMSLSQLAISPRCPKTW